jgi:hypothetical protein
LSLSGLMYGLKPVPFKQTDDPDCPGSRSRNAIRTGASRKKYVVTANSAVFWQ